jgi:hypothetical protein
MNERFGIRLALEIVAFLGEPLSDGTVVLNDAVVNECEISVDGRMGMGIDVARKSVRRPARVANAERALTIPLSPMTAASSPTLPFCFLILQTGLAHESDSCRIIPRYSSR